MYGMIWRLRSFGRGRVGRATIGRRRACIRPPICWTLPDKPAPAATHFKTRLTNVFQFLDQRLATADYFSDELSVADFALYPVVAERQSYAAPRKRGAIPSYHLARSPCRHSLRRIPNRPSVSEIFGRKELSPR